MSLTGNLIAMGERAPLPDAITRAAIGAFCERARRDLARKTPSDESFAAEMAAFPIALNTADANAQHYEVPTEFFRLVLGPKLKYSSCLYETDHTTLADAEDAALRETCAHADLKDGQRILELGCGWGSLSLWMAAAYPNAQITSVSNSRSQGAAIANTAHARKLHNLTVVTADMNAFQPEGVFDRIVSVEMFEHMANWRALMSRARSWLAPDGRLFIHVFTHRGASYRFDANDPSDWIGKYFFTGGIMPGEGLAGAFPDLFTVEADWRWSGTHYRRTAEDWLANLDERRDRAFNALQPVYGRDTALWLRRWRLFFLATSGLFGHRGGEVWGVNHYRLRPT